MSVAPRLVLHDGDRARLDRLVASGSPDADLVRRARIVLLAADGLANAEIARQTGTNRSTVEDWRGRYTQGGLAALADLPRTGRPVEVDELEIVAATLADGGRPPARLGARQWSARLLGAELGIPFTTVARVWRKWDLQPWRADGLRLATTPELDARIVVVVSRRGTSHRAAEVNASMAALLDERNEISRPISGIKDPEPVADRQFPEPTSGAGDPGSARTTDELLVVALDAVRMRLDALESADSRAGMLPAGVSELTAAIDALRVRLCTVDTTTGAPPPSAAQEAVPTQPNLEAAVREISRNQVLSRKSWLLGRLARNTGPMYERGDVGGSIACGGVVRTPGSGPVRWQAEYTVPDVMAAQPAVSAAMLAAMGHPLRLQLLRQMLLGRRTVGEFQQIDEIGTANQVHHHLRELRPAGLVVSAKRNHYAIPTDRVVPILVIVGAALGRRVIGSAGLEPVVETAPDDADTLQDTEYWMLDHLDRNTGPAYTQGQLSGSIALGGIMHAPGSGRCAWRSEYTVPDVMAADLPSAALTLAALGHSLRLELLRRMLLGAGTVAEFQQIDGIGSPGQVHHHLRELRAAGLVVSARRNQYAVPGDRVVHLLVIIGAALGRRVLGRAGHAPAVATGVPSTTTAT